MTDKVQINDNGHELFKDMQDQIFEHNLDSNQTVCALIELLVWALLVSDKGDDRKARERFEGLLDPMRVGIRENASHVRDITTQLDRMN